MTNWRAKRILVVGGSSGLGFRIAKAFQAREAVVAIVARDLHRLESASQSLADCFYLPCDVTRDEDVSQLFDRIETDWSSIDVLVNAVGKSDRRLALSCSPSDFHELCQTNFLSTVRCTRAAIPLMNPAGSTIVNIASLAAKIATPNMGAYPVSKFAVAAYSQQVRRELRQQNSKIHLMLVCPGPVRRADAGTRYAAAADVPARALQPGGGARLRGIDPDRLARLIIRGCERRQIELILPSRVRLLLAISNFAPGLGDWIVRKMTS